MSEVLMLFTFETVAEIGRLGGSSAWKLNRDRARRCRHAVLVRNDRYEENGIEHGTAFLIGVICCVRGSPPSGNPRKSHVENQPDKSIVYLSGYRRIAVKGFWGDHVPKGGMPVRYLDEARIQRVFDLSQGMIKSLCS